jgi:hypothetical protein
MKDMLVHLEMLQSQIAECERLQGAFARLAAHYTGLARELEAAIVAASRPEPKRDCLKPSDRSSVVRGC